MRRHQHGVAEFAPIACAGPLLAAELDALGKALKEPARQWWLLLVVLKFQLN